MFSIEKKIDNFPILWHDLVRFIIQVTNILTFVIFNHYKLSYIYFFGQPKKGNNASFCYRQSKNVRCFLALSSLFNAFVETQKSSSNVLP